MFNKLFKIKINNFYMMIRIIDISNVIVDVNEADCCAGCCKARAMTPGRVTGDPSLRRCLSSCGLAR